MQSLMKREDILLPALLELIVGIEQCEQSSVGAGGMTTPLY